MMNGSYQSLRWSGTILVGPAGVPAVARDDWSLLTENGDVLARVFRSRTKSNKYYGAVCLGRDSVTANADLRSLPSRRMAMKACENRLAIMANVIGS
jgi:hypothetical protein